MAARLAFLRMLPPLNEVSDFSNPWAIFLTGILELRDHRIAAKPYGALFFCKIFFNFMLFGVVRFHNMWYNSLVFHPEVLCMKLWYDYKAKDPTYFIQQGIRNGKKVTTQNV